MVGDLLGWRAVFWIIGACGAAAFLNARLNLRQAAARSRAGLICAPYPLATKASSPTHAPSSALPPSSSRAWRCSGLFSLRCPDPRRRRRAACRDCWHCHRRLFHRWRRLFHCSMRLLTRRWQPRSLMIGGGAISALAFLVIAANPPWPLQLAAFLLLGIGFTRCTAAFRWRQRSFPSAPAAVSPRCTPRSFSWGTRPDPCSMASRSRNWEAAPPWPSGGLVMLFVGLMCALPGPAAPAQDLRQKKPCVQRGR